MEKIGAARAQSGVPLGQNVTVNASTIRAFGRCSAISPKIPGVSAGRRGVLPGLLTVCPTVQLLASSTSGRLLARDEPTFDIMTPRAGCVLFLRLWQFGYSKVGNITVFLR